MDEWAQGYVNSWFTEFTRPQVLMGTVLFVIGAVVLWHAWKDPDHSAPWPVGVVMPF